MSQRPVAVRRRRGLGFIGRSAVLAVTVTPATSASGDSVDDLVELWELRTSDAYDPKDR
jgi:hypothetical protein